MLTRRRSREPASVAPDQPAAMDDLGTTTTTSTETPSQHCCCNARVQRAPHAHLCPALSHAVLVMAEATAGRPWAGSQRRQQHQQRQQQQVAVMLALLVLGCVLLLSSQMRAGLMHTLALQRRAAAAATATARQRHSTSTSVSCAEAAPETARGVLQACRGFPGFCARQPQQPQQQAAAAYLLPGGPTYPLLAHQAQKVASFVAAPGGLAARRAALERLPDRRGILISAGKPHHVGNSAIILHVRGCVGVCARVEVA